MTLLDEKLINPSLEYVKFDYLIKSDEFNLKHR